MNRLLLIFLTTTVLTYACVENEGTANQDAGDSAVCENSIDCESPNEAGNPIDGGLYSFDGGSDLADGGYSRKEYPGPCTGMLDYEDDGKIDQTWGYHYNERGYWVADDDAYVQTGTITPAFVFDEYDKDGNRLKTSVDWEGDGITDDSIIYNYDCWK